MGTIRIGEEMKKNIFFRDIKTSNKIKLVSFLLALFLFSFWMGFTHFYNGLEERRFLQNASEALKQGNQDVLLGNITNFSWDRTCWKSISGSSNPGMSIESIEKWLGVHLTKDSSIPNILYRDDLNHIPRTIVVLIFMNENFVIKSFLFRNPRLNLKDNSKGTISLVSNDHLLVAPNWYTRAIPPKDAIGQDAYRKKRNDYTCSNKNEAHLNLQKGIDNRDYLVIGKGG